MAHTLDDEALAVQFLQEERLDVQKKTFTKWVNSFLRKEGMEVKDLFTDLSDGTKLMKLVEILSKEKIGEPAAGDNRFRKLQNANKALNFLSTKTVRHNIEAADIVDGNPQAIMGLIWNLIQRFHIKLSDKYSKSGHKPVFETAHSNEASAQNELLTWCQKQTASYPGINIRNFSSSWKDGLAFNALIHSHRPDLINMNSLLPSQRIQNLNNAFTVAEIYLDIPRLLDPEEIDVEMPDDVLILIYVSLYFQKISRLRSTDSGPDSPALTDKAITLEYLLNDYDQETTKLLDWIEKSSQDFVNRETPKSSAEIQLEYERIDDYVHGEKRAKYKTKLELEEKFHNINSMFQDTFGNICGSIDGEILNKIQHAWEKLEREENMWESKLSVELVKLTEEIEEVSIHTSRHFIGTEIDSPTPYAEESTLNWKTVLKNQNETPPILEPISCPKETFSFEKFTISSSTNVTPESEPNLENVPVDPKIAGSISFNSDCDNFERCVGEIKITLESGKELKNIDETKDRLQKCFLELPGLEQKKLEIENYANLLHDSSVAAEICVRRNQAIFLYDTLVHLLCAHEQRIQVEEAVRDFQDNCNALRSNLVKTIDEFQADTSFFAIKSFTAFHHNFETLEKELQFVLENIRQYEKCEAATNNSLRESTQKEIRCLEETYRGLELERQEVHNLLYANYGCRIFTACVASLKIFLISVESQLYSSIPCTDLSSAEDALEKHLLCGQKISSRSSKFETVFELGKVLLNNGCENVVMTVFEKKDEIMKYYERKSLQIQEKIDYHLFLEEFERIQSETSIHSEYIQKKCCKEEVQTSDLIFEILDFQTKLSSHTKIIQSLFEKGNRLVNSDHNDKLNIQSKIQEMKEKHEEVEAEGKSLLTGLLESFELTETHFLSTISRSSASASLCSVTGPTKRAVSRTDSYEEHHAPLNATPIQLSTPKGCKNNTECSKTPVVIPASITEVACDPTLDDSAFYPRGKLFALVINVETNRPGAEKDEPTLVETLSRCGFEVDICKDWTKKGILDSIECFKAKTRKVKEPIGAVLVAVGSHGDDYDDFYASDGKLMILYENVIDQFNGANCKELQNIPKVFLVNVCRGKKRDAPNKVQTDSSWDLFRPIEPNRSLESWWRVKTRRRVECDSVNGSLPTWANLLIAYASYDRHVAYRDIEKGTWFFQEFCAVIRTDARKEPTCLEAILKKVSVNVSMRSTELGEKQMPTWKNVGFHRSFLVHYK